jgi:hypothetical protein
MTTGPCTPATQTGVAPLAPNATQGGPTAAGAVNSGTISNTPSGTVTTTPSGTTVNGVPTTTTGGTTTTGSPTTTTPSNQQPPRR